MIILTIRTDKPESEIGLYRNGRQIKYVVWEAHRRLAETINSKIKELLDDQNLELTDVQGLVVYKGPGSFTGLRIGLSVANALAYGYDLPIVGVYGEEDWIEKGISGLGSGDNDVNVVPEYGAPVNITTPKK